VPSSGPSPRRRGGGARRGARGGAWACRRRPRRRRRRPLRRRRGGCGLGLLGAGGLGGVELGGDEGLVLGAQVDLVVEVGAVGRLDVALLETLLTLERADLLHGHLELVRDPRIGASLANPGADLVEVWAERSAGHERRAAA
jgi:hypothetical protein